MFPNKTARPLVLLLILITIALPVSVSAQQEMSRTLTLTLDNLRVDVTVPHLWQPIDESQRQNRAEMRSAKIGFGDDVQRVVVQVDDLDSLPDNNRIGIFMQELAATLDASDEFPTELVSEVVRFRWDGFPAALFLSYSPGDEETPTYYARWFGLELADGRAIYLELGTTLPDATPPSRSTLDEFDGIMNSLRINGQTLDPTQAIEALKRVTDPLSLTGPVVASLRLVDGPEVRLSAPPGWQRRVVTSSATLPAAYFFEEDLREIEPGEQPSGAFILMTLLDEAPLRERLGVDELPPVGNLGLAYLNTLLAVRAPDLTLGSPVDFEWGEGHYAILLSGQFSDSRVSMQLLVLELDGRLLTVALYAPSEDWRSVENVLGSLRVNGDLLPAGPLQEALSRIAEEEISE